MSQRRYAIEPLGRHHDRAGFSCGEAPLDRYLRQQARQDVDRSLAAVFVLVERASGRIAGYYTLSALSIELTDLPEEVSRKLPRYPIPAALIGRLAIDLAYRGQGLGQALLFDALIRAYVHRRQVGAMAVIVDAKHDQARAFYEHHGFQRLSGNAYRLFLSMATIGRLLSDEE